MKKIVLFSLIACMSFVNVVFSSDNCVPRIVNGRKVCELINVGGGYEEKKCLESTFEPGYGRYSWCATESVNKYWYDFGHSCSPENAPANSGHCIDSKKTYQNKHCKDGKGKGEGKKECNCDGKDTEVSGAPIASCAAKYCNDGYLLYTTNKRSEIRISDVLLSSEKGIMLNRKVASQGLCRSRKNLESICANGCGCDKNEKCVLNEVVVDNYNRKVPAYVGEEMCVCVADDNGGDQGVEPKANPEPCTPSECKITLNQSVICKNGNHIKERRQYQICKEDLVKLQTVNCKEAEKLIMKCDDMDCIEKYITQTKKFKELIAELCEEGNVSYVPDSARLEEAKRTVSSFFASAKKDVWKDAEGNFNTARLASDLTAGVVLGTVGGVVSGVVIKKKQIEKGFDALHCSVGGQNIADWGDIFNVGLRR